MNGSLIVSQILAAAAEAHHTTPDSIFEGSREARVVRARRQAIFALRDRGYSTTRIGKLLGGLHHTSVCYHLRDYVPQVVAHPEPDPLQRLLDLLVERGELECLVDLAGIKRYAIAGREAQKACGGAA